MNMHRGLGRLVLVFLMMVAACSSSQVRDVSGEATRAVVDAAVEKEVRKKVFDAVMEDLNDPRVGKLLESVTSQWLDQTSLGLEKKMGPLTEELVRSIGKALREQKDPIWQELLPQIESGLRRAVRRTLAETGRGLKKAAKGDLAVASQLLAKAAVQAGLAEVQRAWQEQKSTLWAELEQMMQQRMEPMLSSMVQRLAKDAVHGLKEGFQEVDGAEKFPSYEKTVRRVGFDLGVGIGEGLTASVAKDPSKPLFTTVIIILSALSAGTLLVALVFLRRYRQAAKSLTLFVHQMGQSSPSGELMDAVFRAHEASGHRSFLQRFLKQRGLSSGKGA